jgi:hypothetical protein
MNDPRMPTVAELLADMEASDAEIEAGLTVPAEVVHRLFDDALPRLETKKAARPKLKPARAIGPIRAVAQHESDCDR